MRVKVKKSDPPESTEVLGTAIVKISEAFDALIKSGLNRDAIVVLIHDKSKISKRDIRTVLNAMAQLRGWYCRD